MLFSLEPCDKRTSGQFFQPSGERANRILLASVLLSIHAVCLKRESCLEWTVEVGGDTS